MSFSPPIIFYFFIRSALKIEVFISDIFFVHVVVMLMWLQHINTECVYVLQSILYCKIKVDIALFFMLF